MKRIVFILVAALAVGVGACVVVYFWNVGRPPEEWMGKRLGLRGSKLEAFTLAHNRYASTCAEMCRKIQASDERLASLILGSRQVTPEIEEALAASDALRNECRRNMLAHFYEVAGMLEPSRQKQYLQLVLPLIVEPGLMSRQYHHE